MHSDPGVRFTADAGSKHFVRVCTVVVVGCTSINSKTIEFEANWCELRTQAGNTGGRSVL
jgi:hypothetical protein